jgi:hypothetical protein
VFTGDPQVPTAAPGDNDTSAASTAFVTAADNAVKALLNLKADIASPTFTGDPKAPTPADADNDTSIPTTAWVRRNFATFNPASPPPAGTDLSAYAPLASPTFTGDPKAPTPAPNDNDTSVATTAFVMAALGAVAGGGGGSPPPGSSTPIFQAAPQGRLTLQSQTPVMVTDTTGATQVFYTPYVGDRVPIFDGTLMQMVKFTEVVGSTVDTTKNPGPLAANKVNDWFIWLDMTIPATPTVRLCHGPDWTSDTVRSAGTALVRVGGLLVNNVAITNGPAVRQGTYVGTSRSDAGAQLKWVQGSAALGGGAAYLFLWNAFNRVETWTEVSDSTNSWTGAATTPGVNSATLNASNNNRVSFVSGLPEDSMQTAIWCPTTVGTASCVVGVGLDSLTTYIAPTGWLYNVAGISGSLGSSNIYPAALGVHFLQALYWASASVTFYGHGSVTGGGGTLLSRGLQFTLRM